MKIFDFYRKAGKPERRAFWSVLFVATVFVMAALMLNVKVGEIH
jgi:hypothetical protein